jgi:hypothetical protein
MARPKAKIQRATMKVPVPFRDRVQKDAEAAGVCATVYLETFYPAKVKSD